jgi:hypothetical protein
MKTKIFVVGYFDHYNIGDEQYKYTFDYIFNTYLTKDYSVNFLDCDLLKNTEFKDDDIIVLGGGDVLNNYFIDQIHSKFKNKPNKIIAISVGIPYLNILIENKLDIIDYIFIRTKQDINILKEFYDKNRIIYIPDISYFLLDKRHEQLGQIKNTNTITNTTTNANAELVHNLKNIKNDGIKIIALTLSRHIYHKKYSIEYYNILKSFLQLIKYLTTFNFHIVLLPFNSNHKMDGENDIIIHNDLYKLLIESNPNLGKSVTNINFESSYFETLDLFDLFYMTIPMRFHACLFSIYKNIPMFPIFTTRKIKNLLADINWNHSHSYELEKNSIDIPIKLNLNKLINSIHDFLNSSSNRILRNKLCAVNIMFKHDMNKINQINDVIDNVPIHIKNKVNIIDTLYDKLYNFCNNTDFRLTNDIRTQNIISQIVTYHLTGAIDSIYTYGLKEKMFKLKDGIPSFNYIEEWKWVYLDNLKTKMNTVHIDNKNGLFNISYIDQNDYSKAHRSGWQYVYDDIKSFNNDDSELYLDLYIDRTFHWHKEINKILEIIPYKKKWIGFIHHTFDTTFSEYNNHNLLKSQEFLDSLKYCNGLFVLSEYLKNQLTSELNLIGMNIPVFSLVHPTELNVKRFSYKKFLDNKDKKLVHIGGWLRNVYAFYNICLDSQYTFYKKSFTVPCSRLFTKTVKFKGTIRKVALKGSNMNNYYPSTDYPDDLAKLLCDLNNPHENVSQNVSQNTEELTNNWYKYLIEHNKKMYNETEQLQKLSNDDYDKLLTENIVFINLIDASAVNTVIESIVRNCPIIVNRHPAVVELLGEKYPLYYGDNLGKYNSYYELNKQIEALLKNTKNIENASIYLGKLDKTKFDVKYFTQKFISYIN